MKQIRIPLVLLCALCFAVRNTNGARILGIFPLEMPGHFVMFQEVLRILIDKGHKVDVVSHFPMAKPFQNYTNIVNLPRNSLASVKNLTFEEVRSMGGNWHEFAAYNYGNEICKALDSADLKTLINDPPRDPPYDLVITELYYANCYLAFGRQLKVPVVAISTGVIPHYVNEPLGNPLNPAFVPVHDDGSISHMNFWQRFKNTMYSSWINQRVRRMTESQSNMVKKYFGPEMPGVRELERDVALVLVNSHYTLNGIRPITQSVVEVGGLHVREEKTELPVALKKWMNESTDGFIYISFGSLLKVETMSNEMLAEMYEAFKKLAPMRVLIKVTNVNDLPPDLPANALAVKWIPHSLIFKHANMRGFVTQGGLMGIQEAVVYKIPFVGIPIFADQSQVVKNCVNNGVALFLGYEEITADKLVEAVKTIVNDPQYKKKMIALSKKFLDRPRTARETTAFWIEYILRNGGDSLRSRAVELTWWQLAILDIYGSIMIALLIMIYIFKLLLTRFIRRLTHTDATLPTSKKMV